MIEQQLLGTFRALPQSAQEEIYRFVQFVAQKYRQKSRTSAKGEAWSEGFFEATAGGWVGEPLKRAPQGDPIARDPLL